MEVVARAAYAVEQQDAPITLQVNEGDAKIGVEGVIDVELDVEVAGGEVVGSPGSGSVFGSDDRSAVGMACCW